MKNGIKIYAVKHPMFKSDAEILVKANSMTEAIDKFKEHYRYDYDVNPDSIDTVTLKYCLEVIE